MPTLTEPEVDTEMAADWQEILSRHGAEPEAAPETPEPDAEEPSATPSAPAEEGAAREQLPPRDEKSGRFQKSPKSARGVAQRPEASAATDAAAPAREEAPDASPEPPAPEKAELLKPPTTWRPTARAEWSKLSETVRAEIKKRESDYAAGQAQVLPDARFGQELREVIEPYRMLIESEGATPATAVKELLRTAAVLRTGTIQQKYQTIAAVARQYGIDLRAFAPRVGPNGQPLPAQVPSAPPQPFRDPRVDQLLQQMSQQEAARVAAETQRAEASATQWLNETDAQGNLLRPYATDVLDAMVARIPAIQSAIPGISHAEALQRAYEAEIWANPEIRTLLQQQAQAAAQANGAAANRQRTEAARRAASVNTRPRGALPQPVKPGSMEETIVSTARELGLY